MNKKEKDYIVELEVSGKILTKEKAPDEEKAVSQAEEWDYIRLPENVENHDVEVTPVDVEEISKYQLSKEEKDEIWDEMYRDVSEREEGEERT